MAVVIIIGRMTPTPVDFSQSSAVRSVRVPKPGGASRHPASAQGRGPFRREGGQAAKTADEVPK